jgi:hypothetical protein
MWSGWYYVMFPRNLQTIYQTTRCHILEDHNRRTLICYVGNNVLGYLWGSSDELQRNAFSLMAECFNGKAELKYGVLGDILFRF